MFQFSTLPEQLLLPGRLYTIRSNIANFFMIANSVAAADKPLDLAPELVRLVIVEQAYLLLTRSPHLFGFQLKVDSFVRYYGNNDFSPDLLTSILTPGFSSTKTRDAFGICCLQNADKVERTFCGQQQLRL
jgi:hypothetical protein